MHFRGFRQTGPLSVRTPSSEPCPLTPGLRGPALSRLDLVNEPILDGSHEPALGTSGLVALQGDPGRVFDHDPRFELVPTLRTLDDDFHSRHVFPPTLSVPSAGKELRPPATFDVDKPGGRCGGMLADPRDAPRRHECSGHTPSSQPITPTRTSAS